jgi:hypothetical protein
MSAAVTDGTYRYEPSLPLHQRRVQVPKTVTYFYCPKCGREERFSWFRAYCTESGELVCLGCSLPGRWRLCHCRQPCRVDQFGTKGLWPCESSICNDCRSGNKTRQPLQAMCAHCGEIFAAKRSDARFCSGRCRTATHRARSKR